MPETFLPRISVSLHICVIHNYIDTNSDVNKWCEFRVHTVLSWYLVFGSDPVTLFDRKHPHRDLGATTANVSIPYWDTNNTVLPRSLLSIILPATRCLFEYQSYLILNWQHDICVEMHISSAVTFQHCRCTLASEHRSIKPGALLFQTNS